jgi:hypothetical protein
MDAVQVERQTGHGGADYVPCAVQVWVKQGYRETGPEVHLEEDHRRGIFIFTHREAERIAKALDAGHDVTGTVGPPARERADSAERQAAEDRKRHAAQVAALEQSLDGARQQVRK